MNNTIFKKGLFEQDPLLDESTSSKDKDMHIDS